MVSGAAKKHRAGKEVENDAVTWEGLLDKVKPGGSEGVSQAQM